MFAVGRCCRQRVQGVQTLGASLLAPSSPLRLDSGQQFLPEGLWGGRHSLPSGKVIAKQLPLPRGKRAVEGIQAWARDATPWGEGMALPAHAGPADVRLCSGFLSGQAALEEPLC